MSDFLKAVDAVRQAKARFLMVARRWNVELREPLDVSAPDWEERLRDYVSSCGEPAGAAWIDCFAFSRGLFGQVLPFAIGRPAVDNWLLWRARCRRAAIVDASAAVMLIHQSHGYAHHPQGQQGLWEGPEAERNRELMGGWHHFLTLADATHRLSGSGLQVRRRLSWDVGARRWWRAAWMGALIRSFPVRRRLGLRRPAIKALWHAWRGRVSRKGEKQA
jgi:hypothetical protein